MSTTNNDWTAFPFQITLPNADGKTETTHYSAGMTQPDALRLADALDNPVACDDRGHALDEVAIAKIRLSAAAELRRLHDLADKYKWQVRDTCARAEKAEAQRDELLRAARLVIAWYEAEDDHSKADFYQRLEMCRASEAALRAAIAKAEGA